MPTPTAPTGQTITVNGGPFFSANSVPLTISRGTDAGAGVDPAGDVVERATAPLRNGVCGTFGPFTAVTLVGGADNSVTTGSCYRWQLKVTDYVGNVSTASAASDRCEGRHDVRRWPRTFFSPAC